MKIEFVPFERSHLDEVELLEKICFTDPFTRGMLESALDSPRAAAYVASADGKVVGYLELYDLVDTLSVNTVETAPKYRGKGIAARFLSIAENEAAARGIDNITLEVRASNAAAISLYEKNGFIPYGIRRDYYFYPREDAILYIKQLGSENRNADSVI